MKKVQCFDRRKIDEIMDVLESNANSEVFELHGSVIDEPVEIQSIKVYVPNDDEGQYDNCNW